MEELLNMIAVPFKYQSKDYCSLVRVKDKHKATEFHVTIMNGDLERQFYGNHIYTYENGVLQAHSHFEDQELSKLQEQIGWAIMDYLEQNSQKNGIVA